MSTLTPTRIATLGSDAAPQAAHTGDVILAADVQSDCILEVHNGSGSPITVTLLDAGTTPAGNTAGSQTVGVGTVAAGATKRFKPPASLVDTAGHVTVTYSATASVTAELLSPRPPAGRGHVGGVAVGGLQPFTAPAQRAADYQAVAATGATWIRSDLAWMYLEQSSGVWSFDLYDPVVADAKSAGCRYLAVLHTVPAWANASGGDYALPTDLTLIRNYAYRTALHYIPMGVTDFEIGNEVNADHAGWVNPSGVTYATSWLPQAAAGVRQAATELGATVNIVFGSLLPFDWASIDPATFLTDAYANGAHGLFDTVGWHPYSGGDMPSVSTQFTTEVDAVHAVMAANGDGAKKIWATEFGQATGGTGAVTEAFQAALVSDAFTTWTARSDTGGPFFWYSGRDTGTSSTDREQHFGLQRYDGSKKPAYAELTAALRG